MAQETAEMSSVFAGIAGKLGIDEGSLLYLFTIFSCYPLMYISRTYLHGQSPMIKHVYFIVCSLTLAFCNFGYDIMYSVISVLLNYALLVTVGGSSLSVAISFALNMGYLLTGYILVSTDGYDINWTTPHCILTLRMISTAFDLYDGKRDEANLSSEQKSLNIKTTPSLLELAGYTYFTGGFFAGPQFSIRRYLEFTAEKLLDNDKGELPNCIGPAMNRFAVGVVYALLETILTPMFSNAYLQSEEFAASSFPYQMFAVVMWHKAVFFKYCTVFLFVEGACIMSGLAYNGKDEKGNAVWDACASIKPQMLETATNTAQYIKSFNLSTNTWVGRYVFKRLKFLNNRYISQTAAVMFLAVWHGMYIGYYICFGLEIFITTCELFVQDAVKRSPPFARIVNNPSLKLPLFILLKFTASISVGYPLVAFVLLRWRRIRLAYQAMYHLPTLFFLGFPFLYQFLILPHLKKQERAARKAAEAAQNSSDNFKNGLESCTGGSAFSVYHNGLKVVDLWGGFADTDVRQFWKEDTMTVAFSATKGMAALCMLLLIDRGLLDYENTVAFYWPEFAQNGKKNITVRMLLNHEAGLASTTRPISQKLLKDHDALGQILAESPPQWVPGTAHGYHAFTFGLYCSQLLRRVDPKHRTLGQFFREEIAEPFDIDFHIGLPLELNYRVARLTGALDNPLKLISILRDSTSWCFAWMFVTGRSIISEVLHKSTDLVKFRKLIQPEARALENPSASGIGTARAIAKVYGILANGGQMLQGQRLLSEGMVDRIFSEARSPTKDKFFCLESSFSTGFFLTDFEGNKQFGHPGAGGQQCLADPKQNLGIAYLSSHFSPFGLGNDPRYLSLQKATYKCVTDLEAKK